MAGSTWAEDEKDAPKTFIGKAFDGKPRAIRDVKILLKARGYKTGPINEELDDQTMGAIKLFEEAHNFKVTGQVSDEVYTKLIKLDDPKKLVTTQFDSKDGCKITVELIENKILKWGERCSIKTGWDPVGEDGVIRLPGGIPIQ